MTGAFARIFEARRARNGGTAPAEATSRAQADAFRTAILPYLDGAYNLACYLTRDPAMSEDVVQDAMLRALRAFGQFRGASPRAWLYAIVRNCARSALAARQASDLRTTRPGGLSTADDLEHLADGEPGPEDVLIKRQGLESMRSLLNALPEPFREALVLRELEELSYREIAEVTGVAIGTVMSRLARARAMLVHAFDDGALAAEARNSA